MTATSLTKIVFPRQLFFLSTNHVDASDSTSMANHHPPNQSAADLEPGRLARAYRQVVILLFLALPLLMLLRWAVEVFPNDLDWNFLTPIDERYVLIQRESMLQGWSKTGALNRYLVLDSASGQVTQLSKVIATSVQPDHVQVLPRGRLLWTTPKHAASVHVTEFRSGQTARYLLSDQPILIGKRFEICTSPLALISWLDLDASRPTLETTSQVTCYSQVTPLRDASVPAFYDLYQVQKIGGVDLSEMEGMMPARKLNIPTQPIHLCVIQSQTSNLIKIQKKQRKQSSLGQDPSGICSLVVRSHCPLNRIQLLLTANVGALSYD